MKTIDGVAHRLPVKYEDGSIDLIEIDGIFIWKRKNQKKGNHEIITFLSDATAIWLW